MNVLITMGSTLALTIFTMSPTPTENWSRATSIGTDAVCGAPRNRAGVEFVAADNKRVENEHPAIIVTSPKVFLE